MFSTSLKVSLIALSLAGIAATGCFKKAEPVAEAMPVSSVVGTWVSAAEGDGITATVTFAEDGSFVIDTNATEGPELTGQYTATDTAVTLKAETANAEECTADATYAFVIENGMAQFQTEAVDGCATRAEVLGQTFSKR